ncbi:hypothetical protein TH66_19905 [Carbonactinospora thermoautotrophica]|uniref:DUF6884 domain-containing protein n=1 Tax=Carbonactinospora thermoautotrophica TaxID=1469144 RepID=A0A132MIT2_9ACTN|nr:DUF6884 domain-containing protein [Carbonactinospora thermoautotrophica]KWW97746.1 hypothetical protein TH66_19905 [Carbonactinospora thermoautotrophica]KWW98580.1 hypothetical protein LI90_207 [Carbonactinospora thermoautotrophica]KWX06234.1 hypothetical protein TR74_22585 [Carbonactinospora thermoautotrophica]
MRMHSGLGLVIAGCSRRKTPTRVPVPALELYQGGIAPQLRRRLGARPEFRERIRFLSAEHGLITADQRLLPYDRPLTAARAVELRPRMAEAIADEFAARGVPEHVLIVAEPLYLVLLADLLAHPARPLLHWIPDPRDWPRAAAVLDAWRWP